MAGIGFNSGRGSTNLGNYERRYVIITPLNHASSHVGRVVEINDEWVVLNPYIGSVYTEEKPAKKLIEDNFLVSKIGIEAVEPTTRGNIEAFIAWFNREEARKREQETKPRQE